MRVVVVPDEGSLGVLGASLMSDALGSSPSPAIGLATGSSPDAVYRELARRVVTGASDFSAATAFALDEYVGLPGMDPNSYAAYLAERARSLGIHRANLLVPNGVAADLDRECEEFEARIAAAGGLVVQLLGIGENGHIGFNEPGSSFDSRTRVVALAGATRRANARFFTSPAAVPHQAITQGIGTILSAGCLILVAVGEHKAKAIARAVQGPVSRRCPASALQLHPNAVVLVDDAAASRLKRR